MDFSNYTADIRELIEKVTEEQFNNRQDYLDACREIIKSGTRSKDIQLLGLGYYYLSEGYFKINDYGHFTEYLARGISYQRETNQWMLLTRSYNMMGISAVSQGNITIAVEHYLQGLRYGISHGCQYESALIDTNMGQLYMNLREFAKAVDYLQKARKSLEFFIDVLEQENTKKDLGEILTEVFRVQLRHLEGKTQERDNIIEKILQGINSKEIMLGIWEDILVFGEILLDLILEETPVLKEKSEKDALTGLPNRYKLNEYAEDIFEKAYQSQKSLGVEIMDADNFKAYNDQYGHPEGDEYLKVLGKLLRRMMESYPEIFCARYGGDEFVVIFYDKSDKEILTWAQKLKQDIGQIDDETNTLRTISQGICNIIPKEKNRVWDYLYSADNALYKMKQKQKNGICLVHEGSVEESDCIMKDGEE